MPSKKAFVLAVCFFLLAGFVSPVFAIFEKDLPLTPAPGVKARGIIEVENDTDSPLYRYDVKLTITALGLKPREVYTVWLVQKQPGGATKGLGVSDYSFTADGSGTGRFISTMPEYQFAYWDTLEIKHHPDHDPKNLSGAETVLRADLTRAHPY